LIAGNWSRAHHLDKRVFESSARSHLISWTDGKQSSRCHHRNVIAIALDKVHDVT